MLLQQKKNEYDTIIYEAKYTTPLATSIPHQKLFFEIHLASLGAFAFLDAYFIRIYLSRLSLGWLAESHWSWFYAASIAFVSLGVLYCLISILSTSFSRDCIFENGIMCFNHSLLDYLKKHIYHPFESISKIEVGELSAQDSQDKAEFLRIYEKNRKNTATILYSSLYENDYWNTLKSVLKEKCPQASWVKMVPPEPPKRSFGTNSSPHQQGVRTT